MFEPVYETTPDAVIKVVGVGGGGGNALNHMVRSCQEDDRIGQFAERDDRAAE